MVASSNVMRRQCDLGRSFALLALCLGGLLFGGRAMAQSKKTVVVLEFVGAPAARTAVNAALKKSYTLVPLAKWNAAAKRLSATGRAADEIATVAADLNVDVVITATAKKDKEAGIWTLSVSPRRGSTGKASEKLKYPLKSPRVDAATIKQLVEDIGPAVEKALLPEPEKIEKPDLKPDVAVALPPGRDDDPLEKLRKAEEDEKRLKENQRPRYYPYFDVSVGLIAGGRSFSFTEEQGVSPVKCYDFVQQGPSVTSPAQIVYKYGKNLNKCPTFSPSASAGLRFDVTAYPLAGLHFNILRGLGIGGTFDVSFWQPSKVCNMSTGGTCTVFGSQLNTSEFRAEVGLRWAWNILNKRGRPSLLFMLQYGAHRFAIQKETKQGGYPVTNPSGNIMGVDDHGLPDILYQYVDIGIGARVPYYSTDKYFVGLLFDFHYHIMLDYGDIQSQFIDISTYNGGYGPVGGGYGLRVSLTPIELMPWKGLTVRVQGYYETFSMNFDLLNPDKGYEIPPTTRDPSIGARHLAQGATDQYFGGVLQVGWQY